MWAVLFHSSPALKDEIDEFADALYYRIMTGILLEETAKGETEKKPSYKLAQNLKTNIIPNIEIGGKLPTEREVAEQFGFSRTIVREAFLMLEIEGLISIKKGSGSTLLKYPDAELEEQKAGIGPFELIQARVILECSVIELAAQIATPTDIRDLSQLSKKHEFHLFNRFDAAKIDYFDTLFHIRIAESTHNLALIHAVSFVRKYSGSGEYWDVFKKVIEQDKAQLTRAFHEHKAILDAIATRNPKGAKKAMHDHIHRKWGDLKAELERQNIKLDELLFDIDPIINSL